MQWQGMLACWSCKAKRLFQIVGIRDLEKTQITELSAAQRPICCTWFVCIKTRRTTWSLGSSPGLWSGLPRRVLPWPGFGHVGSDRDLFGANGRDPPFFRNAKQIIKIIWCWKVSLEKKQTICVYVYVYIILSCLQYRKFVKQIYNIV